MKQRSELEIVVPVLSEDRKAFLTDYKSKYYHGNGITTEMFTFITSELPKFGVTNTNLEEFYFPELIKNAYDSYASRGLKVGENLVLKVVIQEKEGKVIVKVKDNGAGFIGQPKSTYFTKKDIVCAPKSGGGFLGGSQMGLGRFEQDLQKYSHGAMYLKNRKEEGATIYMEFKPDPKWRALQAEEKDAPEEGGKAFAGLHLGQNSARMQFKSDDVREGLLSGREKTSCCCAIS